MQSSRTFLFVFMQCKVQEVAFCHSISALAQLPGLMMMSHAYPLFYYYYLPFELENEHVGVKRFWPDISDMYYNYKCVSLFILHRKKIYNKIKSHESTGA